MPASLAAAPLAAPPSTLCMSPDRGAAGKLAGNLYIAAKTIIEGRAFKMEEVRHEIRTLLSSTSTSTSTAKSGPSGPAAGAGSSTSAAAPASAPVPGAISAQDWKKQITGLLIATEQLPNAIRCLSDAFKREIASAIQLGRHLCVGSQAAAADALKRIDKAAQIYRTLSGPSYL
ncbi:MAG TPA: hypothetical protein VIY53_19100 [Acidobacteriaceae bacterium]